MSIGVFDSGYGGLVVLRELVKQLPEYSYVYLGDNARAPYGTRTPEEIYQFTLQAVDKLFAEGCELVILACNTASANALRRIQQHDLLRYPGKKVLGILVPTIEQITGLPWSALHPYPQAINIGVFATQATVNSHAYKTEILHRNPQAKVVEVACPELATLIESGADEVVLRDYVKQCVDQLRSELPDVDAVLLGCTHYPLVLEHFVSELPGIPVFDQGQITADALRAYLSNHPELEKRLPREGDWRFLTTAEPELIEPLATAFFGLPIQYEKVVLS
ncbi:MAG: glutamate racemase [Patescibacteria group bacterium]|nr:glutamate racemase [Patescibacteria group bacterium]